MDFEQALVSNGFQPSTERTPRGAVIYEARPNRYLTYNVQAFDDGTALFTFEFAIGAYLLTKGIQIGSDETLNQFAYPRQDVRGQQDPAWLTAAIERAEALLADVRLDRPEA